MLHVYIFHIYSHLIDFAMNSFSLTGVHQLGEVNNN